MIPFQRLTPADAKRYQTALANSQQRGCEYSFVNLCIWGRQKAAFMDDSVLFFSQFDRFSVYPFPLIQGDCKTVLDMVIHDAKTRGIPCRISSMTPENCALLEQLYPGQFRFHADRDGYDYVYQIRDLATLAGKRYQSKRNFVNRFRAQHPDCQYLPLNDTTLSAARQVIDRWYESRLAADPFADFHLEQIAIDRALHQRKALDLVGMVLIENGTPLAMTLASKLSDNTFDVHFEKALDGIDGAYAAINHAFAGYLLEQYPQVEYLNREDDMGIPGLRKAKLSYHPDHLVAKYWARLWEDDDEH